MMLMVGVNKHAPVDGGSTTGEVGDMLPRENKKNNFEMEQETERETLKQ